MTESPKMSKGDKYIQSLIDIGLDEKQAQVYFSMISLGPATALQIARVSEIKRTTVYSIIEILKSMSLVRMEQKGFKRLFVAESPSKLETIMEMRKINLDKNIGDLMQIYNKGGGNSLIKIYKNLASIKSVYESLLTDIKPGEDYLVIADSSLWFKLDREYFTAFAEKRAKLPIKIRILSQESVDTDYMKKYAQNFNYEVRSLPEGTTLTTNLIITPQKVVIHQLIQPTFAMVIENKNIINMHKEMFEMIWGKNSGQELA
jgi:sugar-specific transcriptional regulator TrmB